MSLKWLILRFCLGKYFFVVTEQILEAFAVGHGTTAKTLGKMLNC